MEKTDTPDWQAIANEIVAGIRSGDIPKLVAALYTYDAAMGNEFARKVKEGKSNLNYGEPLP